MGTTIESSWENERLKDELAAKDAEIERLKKAFDKFIGSCEECTDEEGWRAFMCSCDDYHEAQSALKGEDDADGN